MNPTHLYLARHGQTDWNVQGILQGQADRPLNELGVRQAKELRDSFAGVTLRAVHASDLIRARHTAEIIAAPHALPVVTHRALRERSFGDFEGKPAPSSFERDDWTAKPGVEETAALERRVRTCLVAIARGAAGQTVFVVGHAGALRRFLLSERLLTPDRPELVVAQENGGYVLVTYAAGTFVLVRAGRVASASDTHAR